jgi:hypothetical protein
VIRSFVSRYHRYTSRGGFMHRMLGFQLPIPVLVLLLGLVTWQTAVPAVAQDAPPSPTPIPAQLVLQETSDMVSFQVTTSKTVYVNVNGVELWFPPNGAAPAPTATPTATATPEPTPTPEDDDDDDDRKKKPTNTPRPAPTAPR